MKCEYTNCEKEGYQRCHASCCCGDIKLCDEHGKNAEHVEQHFLDELGYHGNYFGDQQHHVREIVKQARIDLLNNTKELAQSKHGRTFLSSNWLPGVKLNGK